MDDLLASKKFKTCIVGTVAILAAGWLFKDNPELLQQMMAWIGGLFGVTVGGFGLADLGKEKEKEKNKNATEGLTMTVKNGKLEKVDQPYVHGDV